VAEGGELWAQKWCESKPPLMAPQSRAYIMTNPRAACGRPLGIKPHCNPEVSVNEKGVVVETLTHSINRKHGGSGCGDKTVSPRYPYGRFFLQAHVDLSLRLTGGYTHSLTEECTDERL
jgi:hypothetical protein